MLSPFGETHLRPILYQCWILAVLIVTNSSELHRFSFLYSHDSWSSLWVLFDFATQMVEFSFCEMFNYGEALCYSLSHQLFWVPELLKGTHEFWCESAIEGRCLEMCTSPCHKDLTWCRLHCRPSTVPGVYLGTRPKVPLNFPSNIKLFPRKSLRILVHVPGIIAPKEIPGDLGCNSVTLKAAVQVCTPLEGHYYKDGEAVVGGSWPVGQALSRHRTISISTSHTLCSRPSRPPLNVDVFMNKLRRLNSCLWYLKG